MGVYKKNPYFFSGLGVPRRASGLLLRARCLLLRATHDRNRNHYPNFARNFAKLQIVNTTLFRKEFRESLVCPNGAEEMSLAQRGITTCIGIMLKHACTPDMEKTIWSNTALD